MVTGATPRSVPSTRTLAPAGCDSTRRLPVSGVFANSRYCETLGSGGDVHVDDAGHAASAQLENVRANRDREPSRRLAVIVPVDEHLARPAGFDCTTSVPVAVLATPLLLT